MRRAVLSGLRLSAGLLLWFAASHAASAGTVDFTVALTGEQVVPQVTTYGIGAIDLTYDYDTRVLRWLLAFSGLTSRVLFAQIHGPAERGQVAPAEIWLSDKAMIRPVPGVVSGEATLSLEQAQQFLAGQLYVEVHTAVNREGELRGQIVPPRQ